jgi:hypothetical protein
MATIADNQNGSWTMLLTTDEQVTMAGLPTGQLEAYVTLWLNERGKSVLSERFVKMNAQDRTDVLATLSKYDSVKPV